MKQKQVKKLIINKLTIANMGETKGGHVTDDTCLCWTPATEYSVCTCLETDGCKW